MADGYISQIKTPDNKVYLLKDSEKGYKWNAVTQGQKWSRICLITPTVIVEGSSGILSVSCTRGNVVCNATFLITASHASKCFINALGTTNYTAVRIRGVVQSNGTAYIELYDTAQAIAAGTTQTWHCSYIPILSSTVTPYTAFTDGTTLPSGYTAVNDFTAPQGDNSAPVVSISRSGTTFTATRSNGTTFTFTQQDNAGITSVTIGATSPVQSSTSTAQTGSSASTTISLADAYGDTKNPYGSKTKNYVLAAPSNANGAPGFRALVAADIPDISGTYVKKVTSTDNAIARFDGTDGAIQNSSVKIDDNGTIILPAEQDIRLRMNRKKSDGGGWAHGYINWYDNDNNIFARIGVYGNVNTMNYMYLGADDYSSANNLRIAPDGTITGKLFSGSGASLTNLNGSNISSGTVAAARIDSAIARLASPALTGTPTAPTAADGTNTTQIATTAFVMSQFKYNDAMIYKGVVNANSDLPATHYQGWTYKVGTAGTYAGVACEIGDMIICNTDGTSANNAHWNIIQTNIDGAVIGPASSTDNAIARFDSTTGKIIQNSAVVIEDSGVMKITSSNNTFSIGSQNTSFNHLYNSANIPFIFNNSVLTLSGNLGSTTYPFNNLYIGAKGSRSIYYVGTKATNAMITFLDNTSDAYGNGIKIGGGGTVVVGAGESAANLSVTAGNEILYLTSDGAINIEAGGDTIANRVGMQVTAAGHVIPVKAEAANNNVQNLGTSDNRWATIYSTKFNGVLTPSSWIDGQRYQNGALNIADYSNTGSYNPWIRATNTWASGAESAKVGRWFSFGTLGTSFYWMGSVSTRTENSYDNALRYDTSNGYLYAAAFKGNADTANKLSANASNTTASFWRGDNNWSNELASSVGASTAILKLTTSATIPSSYVWGTTVTVPNLSSGANVIGVMAGQAMNAGNAGYLNFHYVGSNSNDNYVSLGIYSNDNLLKVYKTGNVSIGADNNSYKLYVNGTSYINGATTINNTLTVNNNLTVKGTALQITSTSGMKYILMGNQDSGGTNKPTILEAANGTLYIGNGTDWSSSTGGTLSTAIFMAADRKIGIGTTSPDKLLTVNGEIKGTALYLKTASSDPSLTAGARIEFSYTDGQPVVLSYTPNDAYRAPAGLKVMGGTSATPAWFEVEGNIYAAAFKGNADTATSAGKWTTARTLTIGSTGKSVDGSGNVSWSLADIGAAPAVTGGYLPLSGGTLTGALNTTNNTWNKIGDDAQLGDINKAGHIGIQGINGNTGIFFTTYNQTTKLTGGAITWDGTKFSITSTTPVDASISGNAATATAATRLNSNTTISTKSGLQYTVGQLTIGTADGNAKEGSNISPTLWSYPTGGTAVNGNTSANIQNLRLYWGSDGKYFRDIFISPNNNTIYHRAVGNGAASEWFKILDSNNTYAASSSDVSVAWNTSTTIATINGTAIKIKIPSNPNTNTTYTFAEGSTNGAFSVTPSGGSAQSVSIHGLGALAYKASLSYSDVGAAPATHTHNYAGSSSAGGSATESIALLTASVSNTSADGQDARIKEAIKSYFDNNKANVPRGKTISLQVSTGNGVQATGYFISGYDSNPYGGFFVSHYDTPRYVGVSNGNYSCYELVRNNAGTYGINITGSAGGVAWTNVSGRPTNLNQFTNGPGYTTNTGTVTSVKLIQGAGITVSSSGTAITTTGERTISITGMDTTNGSTTKWLNQKGSWSTPTAANVGALASSTVVTNVAISANTVTNADYPIVFATSNTGTTAAKNEGLQKSGAKLFVNPSTGTLYSTKFCVDESVTLQYNTTDQSLDFIF